MSAEEEEDDPQYQLSEAFGLFSQEHEPGSKYEHEMTIVRLLETHPDLARTVDDMGEYPLHNAAYYGCNVAIRHLLKAGAVVDAVSENRFRQTPLHLAAQQSQVDACRYLADAGADLTRRAANGFTPLLEAIYCRSRYGAIGQLLSLGAPLNLRAAACLRQPTVVRLLVRDNPALVHEEPDAADLVAEAAFFGGGVDVLRPLLEAGADPNAARESLHSLESALRNEDRAAVELLLAHGANPDLLVGSSGVTPRQFAENDVRPEVRKWALKLFDRAKSKRSKSKSPTGKPPKGKPRKGKPPTA